MFYADATVSGTARLDLPAEHEERAAWVAKGRIEVGGDVFDAGQMLVFRPGATVAIKALDPARLILIGTGRGMSGGISCRARRRASNRPRPTGRPHASGRCPATRPSLFRCRRNRLGRSIIRSCRPRLRRPPL